MMRFVSKVAKVVDGKGAKLESQSYGTLTNAIFQGFTTNERGNRPVSNNQQHQSSSPGPTAVDYS